ncbi:MAG: hypothetical protein A3F74_01625 [Betaproteobacteria bacterium RIFCSPLOWO2_12_FULL_62_58]|nr:MAG: hypothetical protein A3F74_01625 [Betaproteobacteria bacterium RIFCSPLOWO2_12_FULL_62_58]
MASSHADLASVAYDHVADVVIALRHLLARLGTGHRIADEKHFHLLASGLEQAAGEPQGVVAAFVAVGSIVEQKQVFQGNLAWLRELYQLFKLIVEYEAKVDLDQTLLPRGARIITA